MTITALFVALAATFVTAGAGYLLGVALGRQTRRRLAITADERAATIDALQGQLAARPVSGANLRDELQAVLAPILGAQEANAHQLQVQLQSQLSALASRIDADDRTDESAERLRAEIRSALAPMMQLDRETKGLHELVRDTLGPLMDRERRAQVLGRLLVSPRGRERLPQLLEAIAHRGGFSAVLLSDEVGLPLAASAAARDADVIAGVSSLVLSLADRIARTGAPAPTSVLVRDGGGQLTLHRIFAVGGERFLVTAVSTGAELSTTALDPALAALESALVRRDAA